MNMLHSEQASAERLELPDGSYLVASPFLIFCLHWHAEKDINPFGCSMFRRGSPTTAALSPARAAGCASKAVPFLFLLFPSVSKSFECDVSIISHVVDAAIEYLWYLCVL